MRDKKEELNKIMERYKPAVQKVYHRIISQEKSIKNIRKGQMKSLIDQEIMKQVQENDH